MNILKFTDLGVISEPNQQSLIPIVEDNTNYVTPVSGITEYIINSIEPVIIDPNWTYTYTTVESNSANWETTYQRVDGAQTFWDIAYDKVSSLSGVWATQYDDSPIAAVSGNWNDTYQRVQDDSDTWDSTYTTVKSNSADWFTDVQAIKNEILGGLYPIGAVYMTVNNNNPGSFLGIGTWQKTSQGRFLVGQGNRGDQGDPTFNAGNGNRGAYKHTLTQQEMPVHRHGFSGANGNYDGQSPSPFELTKDDPEQTHNPGSTYNTGIRGILDAGGSKSHNNVPPEYGVYVWMRVS